VIEFHSDSFAFGANIGVMNKGLFLIEDQIGDGSSNDLPNLLFVEKAANDTAGIQYNTTTDTLVFHDAAQYTFSNDGGSGTTTVSLQTDGISGSCIEWTNTSGVVYREYVDGAGAKVLETGACK